MISKLTRDSLADAAEGLIKRKSLQDISVQSIVEECGTTRSTFYRYFKDKYEIANFIYKREVDEIVKLHLENNKPYYDLCIDILSYLKTNKEFYQSLIKYSGQNSYFEYLVEYGETYFIEKLKKKTGNETLSDNLHLLIHGYCYGTSYLMIEWIQENCKRSIEELSDVLTELVPPRLED